MTFEPAHATSGPFFIPAARNVGQREISGRLPVIRVADLLPPPLQVRLPSWRESSSASVSLRRRQQIFVRCRCLSAAAIKLSFVEHFRRLTLALASRPSMVLSVVQKERTRQRKAQDNDRPKAKGRGARFSNLCRVGKKQWLAAFAKSL